MVAAVIGFWVWLVFFGCTIVAFGTGVIQWRAGDYWTALSLFGMCGMCGLAALAGRGINRAGRRSFHKLW